MDLRSLLLGLVVIYGVGICGAYEARRGGLSQLSESQLTTLRSALVCGLYGDSSSIPVHYETDEEKIVGAIGGMDGLKGPLHGALSNGITQYHRRVSRGGYTHCGYEALLVMNLLKNSVTRGTEFPIEKYADSWMTNNDAEFYNGYMPTAAKRYWVSVSNGNSRESSGQQDSNDMCAFARIVPLLALFPNPEDEEAFVALAVKITKISHAHPHTLEASEFVSRVLHRTFVISSAEDSPDWTAPPAENSPSDGLPYMKAKKLLENVAKDMQSEFVRESLAKAISSYRSSEGKSDIQVLNAIGRSSLVDHSFPGLLFTLLKYMGRPAPQFLFANVLGGGDSAARGVVLGSLMCAMPGFARKNRKQIDDMLAELGHQTSVSRFLGYAKSGLAQIPEKKPDVQIIKPAERPVKKRQRREDMLRCEIDKEQKPKCWIQKNVPVPEKAEAEEAKGGSRMPGF